MRGTITDGVNSTKRFMNKNFKDEEKQVSSDLFLGRFQIERRRYDELFQFDGASNSYYIASYDSSSHHSNLVFCCFIFAFGALIVVSLIRVCSQGGTSLHRRCVQVPGLPGLLAGDRSHRNEHPQEAAPGGCSGSQPSRPRYTAFAH